MISRWTRQEKIHAIHARDIEAALRDLGLLQQLGDGSLKCAICGQPVTLGDIQCLFMQDDQVKVCCRKLDCFQQVTTRTGH